MGTPVLSDGELRIKLPELVRRERGAIAEVIEHLGEFDERRLYLPEACSSLFAYCTERLGYSADEAIKRVRVARLARSFPETLEELRAGRIHLTGLFLLSQHANESNVAELLEAARGAREIEEMLARRFPRPKAPDRIRPLGIDEPAGADIQPQSSAELSDSGGYVQNRICLGPGNAHVQGQLALLEQRLNYRVEFTASSELRSKIDRARELLSHAIPDGDLATLFERALDELIRSETKRRLGSAKPRKRRPLKLDSRHIPVEIARQVHERDGEQCTFRDEQGRRCTERRFLTIEHRVPFALGGAPTLENLCLLCASHNLPRPICDVPSSTSNTNTADCLFERCRSEHRFQ